MSIYTEREMLKYLLECIQEEKKVLRSMYQDIKQQEEGLLNRVREIDNIGRNETKGIYEVQGLISDLSETLSKVSSLIPKVPIDVLLEEIRASQKIEGVRVLEEDKGVLKGKEYELSKQESIFKENSKSLASKRKEKDIGRFNAKVHGNILIEFMKEKGRPVSTSEIKEYLLNKGFTEGNTSNRMTAMMKQFPKISKVNFGYYQYKI